MHEVKSLMFDLAAVACMLFNTCKGYQMQSIEIQRNTGTTRELYCHEIDVIHTNIKSHFQCDFVEEKNLSFGPIRTIFCGCHRLLSLLQAT